MKTNYAAMQQELDEVEADLRAIETKDERLRQSTCPACDWWTTDKCSLGLHPVVCGNFTRRPAAI